MSGYVNGGKYRAVGVVGAEARARPVVGQREAFMSSCAAWSPRFLVMHR